MKIRSPRPDLCRLSAPGRLQRQRKILFLFNGQRYEGWPGDTLASALLANGVRVFGRSQERHRPRSLWTTDGDDPASLVSVGVHPRISPAMKPGEVILHDGLIARSVHCWPGPDLDLAAPTGGWLNRSVQRFLARRWGVHRRHAPLSETDPWGDYEAESQHSPVSSIERGVDTVRRWTAGWGMLADEADRDLYGRAHRHAETVVIGAGPAGLAAALAAARAGGRVILLDRDTLPGGRLLSHPEQIEGMDGARWAEQAWTRLQGMDDVTVLPRTTALCLDPDGTVIALERCTDHLGPQIGRSVARNRLWTLRGRRVVVACGASEQPMVFAGNDRPGVLLCSALSALIHRWAVLPMERVLIAACEDRAYETALAVIEAGGTVAAIADVRPTANLTGGLIRQVRDKGVPIHAGTMVLSVKGRRGVRAVRLSTVTGDHAFEVPCDGVAMGGGWVPRTDLWRQADGPLVWDDGLAAMVPDIADREPALVRSSVPAERGGSPVGLARIEVIGHAAGEQSLSACLASAEALFSAPGTRTLDAAKPVEETGVQGEGHPMAAVTAALGALHKGAGDAFVDLAADVTVLDVRHAMDGGVRSVDLLSSCLGVSHSGTPDQGVNPTLARLVKARHILSRGSGQDIADHHDASEGNASDCTGPSSCSGTWSASLPTPLPLGALAAGWQRDLFPPCRVSPIDHWHRARGALWRMVEDWRVPLCFPLGDEKERQAIERECRAARERVTVFDASSKGKLDIQGPDASDFLNGLFTQGVSDMGVGRIRRGILLREDGIILDDGTITRLGEDHYCLSTMADTHQQVRDHLISWHQQHCPDLDVFVDDVTEHWAIIALGGPRARDVLARLAPDVYLGSRSFPDMTVQDAAVAGMPVRLARNALNGEETFEIWLPSSRALSLWYAIFDSGAVQGVVPIGLGAQEVLRAECGAIVVGRETDGTVTPEDVGLGDLVVLGAHRFVGRQALEARLANGTSRLQLVGLLSEDPHVVIPCGAHLVVQRGVALPTAGLGHVTSSFYSPTLGRSIALALMLDGRQCFDTQVHIPLDRGRWVSASVVSPVFHQGSRRLQDG